MNMQQKDNQTGRHVFTAEMLGNKDVSTVRRMLGGVHSMVVIMAWGDNNLMANLLANANKEAARALIKARKAQ